MLTSVVGMLSLQTNAMFMLTAVRLESSVVGEEEVRMWTYLMSQSVFHGLDINWERVRPSSFVFVFWFLSLGQVLVPLLASMSLTGKQNEESETPGAPIEYTVRMPKKRVCWTAPLNIQCTYYEALLDTAYAGGMAT